MSVLWLAGRGVRAYLVNECTREIAARKLDADLVGFEHPLGGGDGVAKAEPGQAIGLG